jgi:hypothetical protein
VTTRTEQRN